MATRQRDKSPFFINDETLKKRNNSATEPLRKEGVIHAFFGQRLSGDTRLLCAAAQ